MSFFLKSRGFFSCSCGKDIPPSHATWATNRASWSWPRDVKNSTSCERIWRQNEHKYMQFLIKKLLAIVCHLDPFLRHYHFEADLLQFIPQAREFQCYLQGLVYVFSGGTLVTSPKAAQYGTAASSSSLMSWDVRLKQVQPGSGQEIEIVLHVYCIYFTECSRDCTENDNGNDGNLNRHLSISSLQ